MRLWSDNYSNTFCPTGSCRIPSLLVTYMEMSKEARIIKLKVFSVVINAHLHQIIKGKSDTQQPHHSYGQSLQFFTDSGQRSGPGVFPLNFPVSTLGSGTNSTRTWTLWSGGCDTHSKCSLLSEISQAKTVIIQCCFYVASQKAQLIRTESKTVITRRGWGRGQIVFKGTNFHEVVNNSYKI